MKKSFSFCVNKLHDVIKTRKFDSCQNQKKNVFWILEKIQKKKFFFLFLSRNRIVYLWIKKMRKWMSYSFSSKKIIFWVIENWQKNWHVWNKKLLIKKLYHVENDKKKKQFLWKKCFWIKDDWDSVIRWENLQKKMWTRIK